MIIFPAIDIKDNKCVRLTQGKFEMMNVYNSNPAEVAKLWESLGAEYIHLVDLDGAKNGERTNLKTIEKIISTTNIPVQVGGGIRNLQKAKELSEMGANRIILGTAAVNNQEEVIKIAQQLGEKTAISVDAVNGKAAINGWVDISRIDVLEICSFMEKTKIKTLIYTDILMDGMLKGPNFKEYRRIAQNTQLDIIASGGVTTIEDVKKLDQMNLYGCIIGKSLYDERVDFKEVIKCLQKES